MTSKGRSVASYRVGQHHALCRLGSTKQRGAKGSMADGVQHLPKPVQTNSLRKENGGQDITIDLIRRGETARLFITPVFGGIFQIIHNFQYKSLKNPSSSKNIRIGDRVGLSLEVQNSSNTSVIKRATLQ